MMYSPVSGDSSHDKGSSNIELLKPTSCWDQKARANTSTSKENKKLKNSKSRERSKHKHKHHESKHHHREESEDSKYPGRNKGLEKSHRRRDEYRDHKTPHRYSNRYANRSRSRSRDRHESFHQYRNRSRSQLSLASKSRRYVQSSSKLVERNSDETTFIGEMLRNTSTLNKEEGSKLLVSVVKSQEKKKEKFVEKEEGEVSDEEQSYTPPLHLLKIDETEVKKTETIPVPIETNEKLDINDNNIPANNKIKPQPKKKSVLDLPMPPIVINTRPTVKRNYELSEASKSKTESPKTPDLKPEQFKHRETHFNEMLNHLNVNPVIISPEENFSNAMKFPSVPRARRPTILNRPQPSTTFDNRSLDTFEIVEKVGEGTYGKVFKAMDLQTNDYVALKYVRMKKELEGFPITAIREIKILRELQHPNVVQLREIILDETNTKGTFLVFEYMNHDLVGLLARKSMIFTENTIYRIFRQLLEGLNYCHKRNFLHRDLKCSNILVNSKGEVKLADFGLGRQYVAERPFSNKVISLWYRPIELLLGEEKYGPPVDVWSLACIFGEMFQRRPVFPCQNELNMINAIFDLCGTPAKNSWPEVKYLQGYKSMKPRNQTRRVLIETFSTIIPSLALDLFDKMLCLNPAKRITAEDALKSNWILVMSEKKSMEPIKLPIEHDCHEIEVNLRRKNQAAEK